MLHRQAGADTVTERPDNDAEVQRLYDAVMAAQADRSARTPARRPIDSDLYTEADLDRYARVLAGDDIKWIDGTSAAPDVDSDELLAEYRDDARRLLDALVADGRLLPPAAPR